ncbi:hypothetical protein P3T76_000524 [Phytophthora citrophthora]|uniref:ubiquitinyl hydrolase 1 n=1 Tax=Phytophthora citrophthora TaxID=4793 RepID=A0AAD9LVI3_9STRA|nr:hypothetical protein P3T76_000524 [Phytophthora citrophthora]
MGKQSQLAKRLRGSRGKQVVLKIDPEASFKTFSELAAKELSLTAKESPTFRRGFPPQPVEVDDSALVKSVFEANDTVVVDMNSGAVAPVQGTTTTKKTTGRPKRAAAKKTPLKTPNVGVHTLNPPTKAKRKVPTKRKITGSGHQLGSSLENKASEVAETVGEHEDEPQRKYRRSKAINLTSKEDVEISLVNAVSGQSNGRAAKFFRAATKNAVEHQYELTLANARLNAALAHNFEMQELSSTRRADGSSLANVTAVPTDLVPDEDWLFIDTRARVMSEKAMEAMQNEEKYKLWKQGTQDETRSNYTSKKTKPAKRSAAKETKLENTDVNPSGEEEVKAAEPSLSAAAQAALYRLDLNAQTSAVVSAFLQEEQSATPLPIKKEPIVDEDETESEEELEEAMILGKNFLQESTHLFA